MSKREADSTTEIRSAKKQKTDVDTFRLTINSLRAFAKKDLPTPADMDAAAQQLEDLKNFDVSYELLKSTDGGKVVRSLSKNLDARIAGPSATLLESWKKAVSTGPADSKQSPKPVSPPRIEDDDPLKAKIIDLPVKASSKTTMQVKKPSLSVSAMDQRKILGSLFIEDSALSHRNVSRCQLFKVLRIVGVGNEAENSADVQQFEQSASSEVLQETLRLACEIEDYIFSQLGGDRRAYIDKCSMIQTGLSKNAEIRMQVQHYALAPAVLFEMRPENFASRAVQERDAKLREKTMNNAMIGSTMCGYTETEPCPKCKNKKCTYYQMQTRSADEPMTTFLTCLNPMCGYKFKR
jgi:transcription elongation factor S-II